MIQIALVCPRIDCDYELGVAPIGVQVENYDSGRHRCVRHNLKLIRAEQKGGET